MPKRPALCRDLPPLGLAPAVALLAGITLVMGLPGLPAAAWFVIACLVGASAWWRGRRAWRLAGALVFGLGLAGLHGHHALSQRIDPQVVGVDLDVELRITGLVRQGAGAGHGAGRGYTGFDAVLVTVPQKPGLEGRRVALGWYGRPPALAPGQVWSLQVRLRRPRGVLNPGGFDRERRALEHRLAGTGYVRQPERARLLSDGGGLDAWRSRTSDRMRERVPHAGMRFVLGLSLGDTRQMQAQDWDALRATGLTHLLAISGFHVGVVAGLGALLAGALSRLWPALTRRLPRPLLMAWTAMACAFVYAAAAGFSLPTQRAVLMIAAALLARLTRRPVVAANSFALALLAVLLLDPLAVLSPGFWLSFLGVGWLLWCLGGSHAGARAPGYLGALMGTQWVASVGLLPLTAWFFGQASVIGPLANLLGIPLVTLVVVPLALLGTLLSMVWGSAGEALLWAAAVVVDLGARGMHALALWPGAIRHLPAPGLPVLLLALTGAAWLLMPRGTPGRPIAVLLFLPLLWPRLPTPGEGGFELHVIDVGQGLALLVRTRSHAMVYDTGPNTGVGMDMGAMAVVPTLRALGVARLDALVISHDDNDHDGGLSSVLRAFPGTTLWGQAPWLAREPRIEGCTGTVQAGNDGSLAQVGCPGSTRACLAGVNWHWDGVEFSFLHPTPHFPDVGNEGSCVLRIRGEGGSALLTGDIGHVVERRLLRLHGGAMRADVLVLGHHGSRGSSSPEFLDAVAPRVVLNASAHASRFNHPHPEVLARLRERSLPLSDTGQHGHVRVRIEPGEPPAVQHWRQLRRRFWHEPPDSW